MTTTPITPIYPDYSPGDAADEIEDMPQYDAEGALRELLAHGASGNHLEITLDWAMHIREKENLSWGNALQAAMIFYFG